MSIHLFTFNSVVVYRKMMTKKTDKCYNVRIWIDNLTITFLLLVAVFSFLTGGTEMTFYEQMVPLLSNLLEIGETLKHRFSGTLLQKTRNYTFGYLGLRRKCDIGIPSSRRFEKN